MPEKRRRRRAAKKSAPKRKRKTGDLRRAEKRVAYFIFAFSLIVRPEERSNIGGGEVYSSE